MKGAASAALLAILALPALADEFTEDAGQIKNARFSRVKDLRRSIEQTADPLAGPQVPTSPEALQAALDRVGDARAALEPVVAELSALTGRYGGAAELAGIDAERAAKRGAVEAGGESYHEELERLAAIQRLQLAHQFQKINSSGPGAATIEGIGAAIKTGRVGKEYRDFEENLRAALEADEKAYLSQRDKLAEEKAQKTAYRRAAAAAVAGTLMLGGAVAGLWRRRKRRSGPVRKGSTVGGNYRLDRELGRGGMGVVWEATDLALRRKVAIKQIRPELRQDPKEYQLFLAEARVVAGLKHPHIVEIYSIVDDPAELLLVFELIAGRSLKTALEQVGKIAVPQAKSLARQVGEALDFAHASKVIHRDLKPENIMITPQGSAKVMDFGLAHQASLTVARLTRAGSSGTPPYMAPEQELGTSTRESDLYSLGVLLYEALTGQLPFPGPNYLAQKRELHFVPPTQRVPALPKEIDGLIVRALQPDPKHRFHSAAELVAAFPNGT